MYSCCHVPAAAACLCTQRRARAGHRARSAPSAAGFDPEAEAPVSHPAPPIQTATVRPSTSRILHCGWYTVTAAPAPHSAENHNCCNRATAIAIHRHACALPSSEGRCGSSMHQPKPGWAPHLKPAAVQQQLCCPLYIQPRRLPGAPRARCSDRGPCGHQAAHALASAAEGEHLTRHMDHMEP
jgi:hypothetical protein